MATAKMIIPSVETSARTSRVVFTMGGKGGVGKMAFASAPVEWYGVQETPYTLLGLDTENKARGSLAHFFPETRKLNIHASEGLDSFVNVLDDGAPIVVADMGEGAGEVAREWFDSMHTSVAESSVVFTAIGLVTPDPASVASVLSWAGFLQHGVEYLIVKNAVTHPADFSYWEHTPAAVEFRRVFSPAGISMEFRLPKVENPARQHGLTLGRIAARGTEIAELAQTTVVMRAQSYRRNVFAEFDRVKDLLLL